MDTTTKLAGRLASLKPQWAYRPSSAAEGKARVRGQSTKYQDQYVFDMDCDEFARFIMHGLSAGFT